MTKSNLAILDLGEDGFYNFSPGLSLAFKAKFPGASALTCTAYHSYAPSDRSFDYWWIENNKINPLSLLPI